jgi:hypothetical protein
MVCRTVRCRIAIGCGVNTDSTMCVRADEPVLSQSEAQRLLASRSPDLMVLRNLLELLG